MFAIDRASFLNENRNILGWYSNEDMITKEIDGIFTALENGQPTYKLKYCAKVKKTFWSVKLDEYGQGTGGGNCFYRVDLCLNIS